MSTDLQDMAALDYAYARVMRERALEYSSWVGLPEYYRARAVNHQTMAATVSRTERTARGVE